MDLSKQLNAILESHPAKPLIVAFSGGCDSTVLLHLLVKLRDAGRLLAPLSAIYVNHQLHTDSSLWASHCQSVAEGWQVPLIVESVNVDNQGKGLEAAAREARYQVFEAHLQAPAYLLLGHHQDDQAETVLLRLLRGAGVAGLAAMAESRPLAQGQLLRPLLSVSRQQIMDYALTHALKWIDDPSNDQSHFDRNFLRNEVLPLLQDRWPNAHRQMANSAAIMNQTRSFLDEQAAQAFIALRPTKERLGESIDCSAFDCLHESLKTEVIRLWCQRQQLPLPDFNALQLLLKRLPEKVSVLTRWVGSELRYFSQKIYLVPHCYQEAIVPGPISVGVQQISPYQSLALTQLPSCGSPMLTINANYRVATRIGGERCKPSWRARSQSVKKLLQEVGLETWLREQVPIIYSGDSIAAVGDCWVCDDFVAPVGEPGYQVVWRYFNAYR